MASATARRTIVPWDTEVLPRAASWNADHACRNDQRRSASVHQGVTRPAQLGEAVRRTWLDRSLDFRRISDPIVAAVFFRVQWKFRLFALMMSMCKSGT
jgi:hypothetical protein